MEKTTLAAFNIIGIAVRTTNANGQAGTDIGALWGKFMGEGIADKIPNKIADDLYSIYTDYAGDHTQPYTAILGCKVENLESIPEGMIGQTFDAAGYGKVVTRGNLTEGAVYGEWTKIWAMDLDRAYTADFEIYGAKAQNPLDAEVDIFVALN